MRTAEPKGREDCSQRLRQGRFNEGQGPAPRTRPGTPLSRLPLSAPRRGENKVQFSRRAAPSAGSCGARTDYMYIHIYIYVYIYILGTRFLPAVRAQWGHWAHAWGQLPGEVEESVWITGSKPLLMNSSRSLSLEASAIREPARLRSSSIHRLGCLQYGVEAVSMKRGGEAVEVTRQEWQSGCRRSGVAEVKR
jgi:hypothetical protein